ncbi:MAG: ferrous iron transport protein B [Capsulimonadaceae bacterium]
MPSVAPTGAGTPGGPAAREPLFALVGNPNCGKTTLFNALTGLRQKVGNYPGVTVEKKIGRLKFEGGPSAALIDLPGLYSLTPRSPDEAIASDVLLGHQADVGRPDGIVHVLDASNLERNLYLTSQVLEIGLPTVIALTMTDIAHRAGQQVDEAALSRALGVPVISVVAAERRGVRDLAEAVACLPQTPPPLRREWRLPEVVVDDIAKLAVFLEKEASIGPERSTVEAMGLLMQERERPEAHNRWPKAVVERVRRDRGRLDSLGIDISTVVIEARYAWVRDVCAQAVRKPAHAKVTLTDKLDRIVTHRIWGYVIFFGVMTFVFQTIFTWANVPMNWIGNGVTWLADTLSRHMRHGPLEDLLVNGIIPGVGTTLQFLPQILLLFFFIALLEDTGYMARAAFLMDKVMAKVGLHGKSFIPLLSSFACAIPGIMATRTIDDRKSRFVTMLVAPLMSCSARLPVYALMIAAFIPRRLQGLTMICMYFLGMFAAYAMAWVFKKTLLRGTAPAFFLEMPPYHRPSVRTVLIAMLERAYLFLQRAGTVILSMCIVLWFLTSYPHAPAGTPPAEQLNHSYAGQMGHVIEPAIKPLGFDWRIGVSLVSSFVAREVFVSSMGTIYGVGDKSSDPDAVSGQLKDRLRADRTFTPLRAVCVMIYYVLAMQCLSTVAVVKRETNGWKWPIFMTVYMTVLAWVVTFAAYHIGLAFGWGIR